MPFSSNMLLNKLWWARGTGTGISAEELRAADTHLVLLICKHEDCAVSHQWIRQDELHTEVCQLHERADAACLTYQLCIPIATVG
jgi:hypothetical protein